MRRKKSGPYLVNSQKTSQSPVFFCTADEVPATGVYRVSHDSHRLPHNVTLFQGQSFPRCAKCQEAVTFELLHATPAVFDAANSFRVYLYELPVMDDAVDDSNDVATG
jgi:hypothetical protein